MNSIQGKPLSTEKKQIIVQLKEYFDRNKAELGTVIPSVELVADALGVGLSTVNRVMANYKKDPNSLSVLPQPKGRPTHAVSTSQQEAVRSYIRSANLNGQYITLETIRDFLKETVPEEEFHISTLYRTLDRWGFEFGKGTRTQHLKEKPHVIAARHRYLRQIRNNRFHGKIEKMVRPEVYLDESYVNKNHSNDFIWYSGEDGPWVQKPTGKGERLIIMNAITENGWVPHAKTVFKSNKKTGDYHGQMNWDIFVTWFTDKLLPNIESNSIIVMDNAPYHNVVSKNSAPTPASSKLEIREWLEKNKITCSTDCLKDELVEILKKIAPEPTYALDEIAKQNGHTVMRTPPYHPELQPIEICWGVVKNEVARNCNFTLKNLETQLELAFEKVTKETCSKVIQKIKKTEDRFWGEDEILENLTEND